MSEIFFVGSYTKADFGEYSAEGNGIYTCSLDKSTGEMTLLSCSENIVNPTYLTLDKAGKQLYSLQEIGNQPTGLSYRINQDSSLSVMNEQNITGGGPCHVSLDKDEQFVAMANYGSGNVVLFSKLEDGSLSKELDSIQHVGSSINTDRQEGPHAHAAVFTDDDLLLVVDLGLDEIKRYKLDRAAGKLITHDSLKVPAGHGPRHLVFHPSGKYLFVVNELISSISIFDYSQATPKLLETVSTLPDDTQVESYCAAIRIHPSGNYIYASNRGHDSIAVFSFDAATADLKPIEFTSTGGQLPRDFNIDASGKLLIAANQQSNSLLSFWLDSDTGKLSPTGHELEIGTPVCVAMHS